MIATVFRRAVHLFAAAGLAGTALAGGMSAAHADPDRTCAKREEINVLLSERYGEEPRSMGVSESGDAAFELFVSAEGTWTITMTTSNGLSCVMAAGKHWEDRAKVAAKLPKS